MYQAATLLPSVDERSVQVFDWWIDYGSLVVSFELFQGQAWFALIVMSLPRLSKVVYRVIKNDFWTAGPACLHPYHKSIIFLIQNNNNCFISFVRFLFFLHCIFPDMLFSYGALKVGSLFCFAHLLIPNVLINVVHTGRGCRAPSLGLCLPWLCYWWQYKAACNLAAAGNITSGEDFSPP